MIHPKIIATFIICIALIGSIVIYDKKDYLFGKQGITETSPTIKSSVSDKLPTTDWKKSLGVIESTSGSIQILTNQKNNSNTYDDGTLTTQVAQTMFSLFLDAQKNGVEINEDTAVAIADKTLNQINPDSKAKQYDVPDIKVTNDSSNTSIKLYETHIIESIKKNINTNSISELDVFSKILESSDQNTVKKLDPYIVGYQHLILDTLAITVPEIAIGYHMVYLNTLSSIMYDLQMMKQIVNDPVMGYLAFSNYQKDVLKLKVTIDRANIYFSKNTAQ